MTDETSSPKLHENDFLQLIDEKQVKVNWKRTPLQTKSIPKKCWLTCGCSLIVIIGITATIWGLQYNKQTPRGEIKKTKMTNLIVIGGGTGSGPRLATSELLSWNRSCGGSFEFPRLPTGLTGARSVYFHGQVMLCGGWNTEGDCQDNCYKFIPENKEWTMTSKLQKKRSYFSLTKVNQELYVLGGMTKTSGLIKTDTMEKLTAKNKWIFMELKMTFPRAEHCGVYLAYKKSLVVIGGVSLSSTNIVEMLNLETMTWSTAEALPISDLRGHACLGLKQNKEESIIVTGGWSQRGGGAQRKVYRYKHKKWIQEGQLVKARIWHAMGLWNGIPVVVAGRNTRFDHDNLNSLERLDDQGLWKLMSVNLNFKISGHSMVEVPDEAFPCLK